MNKSFISSLLLLDVEVFDFVSLFVFSNYIQKLSKTVLFQVFFGKVLQISLGEWYSTTNTNSRSIFGDFDLISKFACFTIDFNSLAKILSEVGSDENLIFNRLWTINCEGKCFVFFLFFGYSLSFLHGSGGGK